MAQVYSDKQPLVSVILPAYNAAKYIKAAVESILQQTYTRLELIVINDGSDDDTAEVLSQFTDMRLTVIHQQNAGMGATLNKALDLCRGEFIARQDGDDISKPERIEKQVQYLLEHPECALLGTAAEIIDEKGIPTGFFHQHAIGSEELKFDLNFDNPFVHSSVMFKRSVIQQCGAYDLSIAPLVQDYDLWTRIAEKHRINNLEEPLQLYRQVNTGMSANVAKDYNLIVATYSAEIIAKKTGCSKADAKRFSCTYQACCNETPEMRDGEVKRVLKQLVDINGVSEPMRGKLIRKHFKVYKRNYFNRRIYEADSGMMTRLFFRLRRKLYYRFNNKENN